MTKLPITIIILTYNEELNLPKCLRSVAHWAEEIIVVDSGSTDRTKAIAAEFGAKVYEHPFANQAEQFNWGLDHCGIQSEWILRLDADEEMFPELWAEIAAALPRVSVEVNGFYMKRRVYFMGRWIRHGDVYPSWFLRLFRRGCGRSEERIMDEHIVLSGGRAERLRNDFADRNLKDLTFWIEKHNRYASREAAVVLAAEGTAGEDAFSARRRARREWYARLPFFFRAIFYFKYRYIIRLGFLDGKEGLIFHALHAFWYRFLVDAKIYEARKKR